MFNWFKKNKKDSSGMDLAQAQLIMQSYARVLERSDQSLVHDAANLPHAKDCLKSALATLIQNEKDSAKRDRLCTGYLFLSHFQEGIGSEGLSLTPQDENSEDWEALQKKVDVLLRAMTLVRSEQVQLQFELQKLL